jgi:hypothetical protein
MKKISVVGVGPKSELASFSAQPKTFWRAGTGYARIEEAADPENHIHGLAVIAEPDAWTDASSEKPPRISRTKDMQTIMFDYLFNEDTLAFDPALFRPPSGVKIEETK